MDGRLDGLKILMNGISIKRYKNVVDWRGTCEVSG